MARDPGNESFAETINRSQEFPDDTGKGANADLPKLFAQNFPVPPDETIVSNVLQQGRGPQDKGSLFNLPHYNFTAHFQRFFMGGMSPPVDEMGNVEYAERDDSAAYEDLLNRMLKGKAIQRWEERSVLKDGTLIISVCYMEPHRKTPKTELNPNDS